MPNQRDPRDPREQEHGQQWRKPDGQENVTKDSPLDLSGLSRSFLPSIDLSDLDEREYREIEEAQGEDLVVAGKIADVTHFRVGLGFLKLHAQEARNMAPLVRPLPERISGLVLNPDGRAAGRIIVQALSPVTDTPLGRGVLTDELGIFSLPLPELADEPRRLLLTSGLKLRLNGAQSARTEVTLPLPRRGDQALGEIRSPIMLFPVPKGIIGALYDLVEGLSAGDQNLSDTDQTPNLLTVRLGEDACNIRFEQDAVIRRFPYTVLVRLVEPRTTTASRVQIVSRLPGDRRATGKTFSVPIFKKPLPFSSTLRTRFVDRLPVDKPISVDGFRDQLIGLNANTIESARRVPMAGTLGLGYVLNLAQVWKYQGLTLGNLLYSLPLAPGEQQRVAVSERVASATVQETERLEMSEQQVSSLREDSSSQAVFESAFTEQVLAASRYQTKSTTEQGIVSGGFGLNVGLFSIGAGGGYSDTTTKTSGSSRSSLDGARSYTSRAAEDLHRSVEHHASARRSAQRSAIRLASERDRETITTKVITNHNKTRALTVQYWEVLRKFSATTAVEGVNLVCFVPLDLVRFLPPGQPLELIGANLPTSRDAILVRYALLPRHADIIRRNLPFRYREGLRLLEDFAANPRSEPRLDAPAATTLKFSIAGRFLPYERVWVNTLLRSGRQLRTVQMDSTLTAIPSKQFGTREEMLAELKRLRNEGVESTMTGDLLIPESVDPSEIIVFELTRRFDSISYQLDPAKNPAYQIMSTISSIPGVQLDLSSIATEASFTPAQLERDMGGPFVRKFSAEIGTDGSIAADALENFRELPPSGLPIAAVERNPALSYRDLMKIERTLRYVVRNTMAFSKAVWSSLSPEERVIMLEGYTIGLPESGLDADGLTDASQHVPLLNCIANQVLGFYGNCMIMPFSIPASLAVELAGNEEEADGEPLTTASIQEALTLFHREGFSPPESTFTLPTRGVLGEAVLGHCPSAEKIDLTRFWHWQDSPGEEATDIGNVAMRPNNLAALNAPSTLSNLPTIVNNVAGETGNGRLGALAQALAAKAPDSQPFSRDYLGHGLLSDLGEKTILNADNARKDAINSATQMASKAVEVAGASYVAKKGVEKAEIEKETAEVNAKFQEAVAKLSQMNQKVKADAEAEQKKEAEEAKAEAQRLNEAVKLLKDQAVEFLQLTEEQADKIGFAKGILEELVGGELPRALALQLVKPFSKFKADTQVRTDASTAWLTALGILPSQE